MQALSSQEDLDHGTMWQAMRLLLERLTSTLDSATATDDCLDIVVELMGADRGLIVLSFDGGGELTVNARASRKPLTAVEREEISRTLIREARETGEFVLRTPLDSV